MILSHIVAASQNNVIGVNNDLPWSIPEDMKFFRDKTKGKALIMGRKTFESVGHPLPKRLNVVVTRQKDYAPEGAVVVSSVEEGIELCKSRPKADVRPITESKGAFGGGRPPAVSEP
jgi:dihydrofolate reductase